MLKNAKRFVEIFKNYFGLFHKAYDNYLIMGDFNLEPHDKRLGYF